MSIKTRNLIVTALVLIVTSAAVSGSTGERLEREHLVKAAFVYNFIKFVDWPKEKMPDPNKPIIIGVVGSRHFIKAFDPVKDKKLKDRNISIIYFEGFERLKKSQTGEDRLWNEKMEMLKRCHALLLCRCNGTVIESQSRIIESLAGFPVLTIGETDGFLESGGIINFLTIEDRVRFEINAVAAKKAQLKISSSLLRLARRVLKEKGS